MPYKPLHIISFNNPYPPQYGGTIEVYYKIKALHALGYNIHLHCFLKEDSPITDELSSIAEKVYFYKYSQSPLKLFSALPFSVILRDNKEFIKNISALKAPLFFESLKTTLAISRGQFSDYTKILRLHNIEHDYYEGLARSEKNLIKKMIFWLESVKFKRYEKLLNNFDAIVTLSHFEQGYMGNSFTNAVYVPVFHGNETVDSISGKGEYALYHGDLTTSDNRRSAATIIEAFKEIRNYPLIIASGSNEGFIKKLIGNAENITFVKLRDFNHLKQLLNNAHLNIIWSMQRSGTKLKLINALFHSRYCIINDNIIDDEKIAGLCVRATTHKELESAVNELKSKEFSEMQRRAELLEDYLNDVKNARCIDKLIQDLQHKH